MVALFYQPTLSSDKVAQLPHGPSGSSLHLAVECQHEGSTQRHPNAGCKGPGFLTQNWSPHICCRGWASGEPILHQGRGGCVNVTQTSSNDALCSGSGEGSENLGGLITRVLEVCIYLLVVVFIVLFCFVFGSSLWSSQEDQIPRKIKFISENTLLSPSLKFLSLALWAKEKIQGLHQIVSVYLFYLFTIIRKT